MPAPVTTMFGVVTPAGVISGIAKLIVPDKTVFGGEVKVPPVELAVNVSGEPVQIGELELNVTTGLLLVRLMPA